MADYIEFWFFIADSLHGKGGTMKVTGLDLPKAVSDGPDPPVCNVVFPKGTHAIRWKSPDWAWLSGPNVVATDEIFSSDSPQVEQYWGPKGEGYGLFPEPTYTYTGGLLDGPYGKPCFEYPLAGIHECMPPADQVDTLVVQVQSADQVEFLDKSNSPVHPALPEGPELFGAPPPSTDPCEVTPLFCNLYPTRFDSVCKQIKICPEGEESEAGILRGRDLAAAAAQHIRVAAIALATDGTGTGRRYARAALREARARVEKARAFAEAAQRAHAVVLRVVRQEAGMPLTRRYAAEASYALARGIRSLAACESLLDGDPARARRSAEVAYRHLDEALDSALGMRAWAIPAEAAAAAGPAAGTTATVATDALAAARAADAAGAPS
jgi:hypothetical protein